MPPVERRVEKPAALGSPSATGREDVTKGDGCITARTLKMCLIFSCLRGLTLGAPYNPTLRAAMMAAHAATAQTAASRLPACSSTPSLRLSRSVVRLRARRNVRYRQLKNGHIFTTTALHRKTRGATASAKDRVSNVRAKTTICTGYIPL